MRQTVKKPPLFKPIEISELLRLLEPLYGPAQTPRGWDGMAELVYTILSQHTSDLNSLGAYAVLRERFPTWEGLAKASVAQIVEAIKGGGLAQVKAPRIKAVVQEVKEKTGGYDLAFLREMPLPEAKAWLRALPGVGPKTVGCVLLFALEMPALPVDTHVYRVAQRLKLFGPKVNADQSHDILEGMLQPEQMLPFHMYLINHGRKVCHAQRPACGECVLEVHCPSSLLKVPAKKSKGKRA